MIKHECLITDKPEHQFEPCPRGFITAMTDARHVRIYDTSCHTLISPRVTSSGHPVSNTDESTLRDYVQSSLSDCVFLVRRVGGLAGIIRSYAESNFHARYS